MATVTVINKSKMYELIKNQKGMQSKTTQKMNISTPKHEYSQTFTVQIFTALKLSD